MKRIVLPIVLASCATTSSTNNPSNAAIMAGTAVGSTIINRMLTKDCFAYICAYGTECDHESGMCVPLREKHHDASAPVPTTDDSEPEMCTVPDASLLLRVPCDAGAD